jgi:hypothetical protein
MADGVASIDFDGCVECATCLRFAGCPTGAIHESAETAHWPRIIRREFSDPQTPNSSTGRRGRGTGGVKTNDVTGEVKRGEFTMTLEFGRPGVGTRLSELERMAVALAEIGVHVTPGTPLDAVLAEANSGRLKPEVRGERVLTATLDLRSTLDRLPQIVPTVLEVARTAATSISWGITVRAEEDGSLPVVPLLRELGVAPRPNSKVNLGMGRPRVEE